MASQAEIISIYVYGSVVYGNQGYGSDIDLIVVVERKNDPSISSRARELASLGLGFTGKFDINIFTEEEFLRGLDGLEISFIECVNGVRAFTIYDTLLYGRKYLMPKLDKSILRASISKKASNSWVKAKKKLTIPEDYAPNTGKKSAWHALRILDFGTQLAIHGKIVDMTAQSGIYHEIMLCDTWEEIDSKYRQLYNKLSTEFKKVAPKQFTSS